MKSIDKFKYFVHRCILKLNKFSESTYPSTNLYKVIFSNILSSPMSMWLKRYIRETQPKIISKTNNIELEMMGCKENHLKGERPKRGINVNIATTKVNDRNREFPKLGDLQIMIKKCTKKVVDIKRSAQELITNPNNYGPFIRTPNPPP